MKCTSSVRTGERRRKKIRRCWRTTTAELCWAGVMGAGGTVLPVDCDQVGEGEDSSQHALYWSSSSPRPNGYAGIAAAGGMPKRGTALDMNSSSGGVCPIGTARDETLVPVRAGCGGSRAFSSQRWLGAVLQNCVVKRQGCAGSLYCALSFTYVGHRGAYAYVIPAFGFGQCQWQIFTMDIASPSSDPAAANSSATMIRCHVGKGNTRMRKLVVFRSSGAKSQESQHSGAANIPEVTLLHYSSSSAGLSPASNGVCPALSTCFPRTSESRTEQDAEGPAHYSTGDCCAGQIASLLITLRRCRPRPMMSSSPHNQHPNPTRALHICTSRKTFCWQIECDTAYQSTRKRRAPQGHVTSWAIHYTVLSIIA